jgi:serine/threonine protein kinase
VTAPQVDAADLVGGRYARREQLGRGGFGIVWRAHDTLLQRDVAVKEVRFPAVLDEQEQNRLREKVLREARAAARLSHPALVTVFDVVEEDGRPFIVMELVDAPTLAQLVASEGPLSDQRAAAIGVEVLDALTVAHQERIIHRDVKPANVMVGANDRVELGDFGIASIIDDPKVTSSGSLAGSPSYMAPEQAQNDGSSAATDLWGLGATLYFAVEGAPPFEKEGPIPTLASVVNDEPREMQRATTLAPLLRDLLQKDPAQRPSVEETRRRLAEVAEGEVAAVVEVEESSSPEMTVELAAEAAIKPQPASTEHTVSDLRPEPAAPIESTKAEEPPAETTPEERAEEPRTAPTRGEPVQPGSAPPPEPAHDERPPEPRADAAAPAIARRHAPPAQARLLGVARRPLIVAAVLLALALVTAVLVSTRPSDRPGTTEPASPPETSAESGESSRSEDVPDDWVAYQDPATGYTLMHPPDWTISSNGTLTDFRDPSTNAYLRVDYTASPGPSPEQAWRDLEPRFAAENPNYRRLRLTSTTFQGYKAAIWEFTYNARGTPVRSVDLGFVTGRYGFALNFTTRASDWEEMQPVFDAFKASFAAPSP